MLRDRKNLNAALASLFEANEIQRNYVTGPRSCIQSARTRPKLFSTPSVCLFSTALFSITDIKHQVAFILMPDLDICSHVDPACSELLGIYCLYLKVFKRSILSIKRDALGKENIDSHNQVILSCYLCIRTTQEKHYLGTIL